MRILLFFLPIVPAFTLLASPPFPEFESEVVDADVEIGYGVAIADVNGNGKPDILLADKRQVFWYENPTWEKHLLVEDLSPRDNVGIAARIIDESERASVAVGADWAPGDTLNSGSLHYLLPPEDRTEPWDVVDLPSDPTVHRLRWVRNREGSYDLVVVPLHGHGNVQAQGDGVRILSYGRPSNPRTTWTIEEIDNSLHMTHNLDLVTWGDGPAEDILVAAREGVFLFEAGSEGWEKTQLAGNAPGENAFEGASEVRAGLLEGGKRFLTTVEPFHGNRIVTYTPSSDNPAGELWERNVIDEGLAGGHALATGDFVGAGYDQIVAGWRNPNAEGKVGIRIYFPLDNKGKEWAWKVIDDNEMACEDLVVADLNGNGRLDIIAAGRATRNLKIYYNRSAE